MLCQCVCTKVRKKTAKGLTGWDREVQKIHPCRQGNKEAILGRAPADPSNGQLRKQPESTCALDPTVSVSHDHGRSGVDCQATRWGPASGEDNISRRKEMKEGVEPASKLIRKFKRIAGKMDRTEGAGMDRIMAPSAGSYTTEQPRQESRREVRVRTSKRYWSMGLRPHQRCPGDEKGG